MAGVDDLEQKIHTRAWVDDPFLGPVLPGEFLQRSPVSPVSPRWDSLEATATVTGDRREVDEFSYRPAGCGRTVPVAIVWDDTTADATARIYYNKGLIGGPDSDRVRPPLIPADHGLQLHPTMASYGAALRSADGAALYATLHPTFRVRQPDGHYLGGEDIRNEFVAKLIGIGGVPLQYLTSTDDGHRAANEFTSWRHPAHAGLGVYDRALDGLLTEFRSYEGPVYPAPGASW